MLSALGPYRVLSLLGEGGMGIVYEALDERLNRRVALKTLRADEQSTTARDRLVREARAAASISHPRICQVFEVGETDGIVFVAMEKLEGETLATRIARGPFPVADAGQVALGLLEGLGALHERGIVHRDLKPANVFLTTHGVKLVDFGLARAPLDLDVTAAVTLPGTIVGTPLYMSPEQLTGQQIDRRSDLYALGVVLYEMLAGRTPYDVRNLGQLVTAVLQGPVPVIGGSAAALAVDRVIQRAMARRAGDRYPDAAAMADDLQGALSVTRSGERPSARPMTRLVVLPFRLLRPDPDTDFLSFSLADAITSSLTAFDALVVRSSLAGARFATQPLDLRALATEADVDVVVTGTLLRSGDAVRVSAQLLEVPAGTVLWSNTQQLSIDDVFTLQDDIARQTAESLSLPLTAREHRLLQHDVPTSARAYELYLRANQLAYDSARLVESRNLYEQSLAEDPNYAPTWARLGRVLRVLAKYTLDGTSAMGYLRAEAAFKRSLELNPDLAVAHAFYAALEVDLGSSREAMARLLSLARSAPGDAEVFAALVNACRYCGLYEASVAAHRQARRLDPKIPTSVLHTFFVSGDYGRALDETERSTGPIRGLVFAALGRVDEAIVVLEEEERRFPGLQGYFSRAVRLVLQHEVDDARQLALSMTAAADQVRDPEAMFYVARVLTRVEQHDEALALLDRSVRGGYACDVVLTKDAWLAPLASRPEFAVIVARAAAARTAARQTFRDSGGEGVLGAGTAGA